MSEPVLPAGWIRGNIRRFAQMKTGHTPSRSNSEYWDNTSIPWFTLADVWQLRSGERVYLGETVSTISEAGLANSAAELLPTGTVVLSRTASVGFSGIMARPMATSQDYWNWVCGPDLLPEFLNYQLKSMRPMLASLTMGSTHKTIYQADAAALRITVPPLGEQKAIAGYLAHETKRIDELIAEQRGLIETLRERKRSVVDRGAEEAGVGRTRLRHLFEPSDARNYLNEQVLSVYREYGVVPKGSRDGNHNVTPEDVSRYLLVRPGDLVVNRMKAWQGSLGVSDYRGIVSGDYEVLRPADNRLLPQFSHLYLRSARMVGEYAVRSTGIRPSQWRLYWKQMANIEIPVPSIQGQQEIVKFVDDQTSRIEALIAESEDLIALSLERRAAIIAAAVTGQIDVRTAA